MINTSKLRKRRGGAFISFRGRYETRNMPEFPSQYRYSVRDVAERVAQGAYGEPTPAAFVNAGALAYENELLTEQRRWYLLRQLTEQYIEEVDEFWIYGAPDHFSSWWTIGKYAVALFPVRVRCLKVYDPSSDTVTTVNFEDLPRLNLMTKSHLGHRLMDESPSVAANYARTASVWRRLSSFARNRLTKPLVKIVLKQIYLRALREGGLPEDIPYDEFFELIQTPYYHESVIGRSFTKEFWNQLEILLVEGTVDDFSVSDRLDLSVNFDRLVEFSGYQRIPVSKAEIDNGIVRAIDRAYVLRQEKPRFQFAHSFGGRDYSSTGSNLEIVPVVRFWNQGMAVA